MWSAQRIAAVVIVAFWLTMMALLVNREAALPGATSQPLTGPSETWMKVVLPGGVHAGHLHFAQAPESREGEPGRRITVQSRAALNLLGRPSDIALWGDAWQAANGDAARFDLRFRAAEHTMRAEGTVADGRLDALLHTGGETIPFSARVGPEFGFALAGMGAPPDLKALEPGGEAEIPAFSPARLAMGKARVRLLRREPIRIMGQTLAADVVEIEADGLATTAWLNTAGETLRLETPFGFTLERCEKAEALAHDESAAAGDLMRLASIAPSGKTPFTGASRMRVRLAGVEESLAPPDGGGQRGLGDGEWLIAPEGPANDTALEDFTPFLASTPFIQSDHPRIVEKAKAVAGASGVPWEKARLIHRWVFENVAKTPVASLPSALEVLDAMAGDCNEHTVLFTALARAAGVPTEIAVGLVWSEEFGAFYYHAWPEVYAGRWVPMDPTLGQEVADATHIKLLNGGVEQWMRIAPYLTRLKIDVLEIE